MTDYPEGVCSWSRHLFKFWEITDYFSQTVQNRDLVVMNYYYKIECGLSNGPNTNDLEWPWRSLLLFETCLTFVLKEMYSIIYYDMCLLMNKKAHMASNFFSKLEYFWRS